MIKRLSTIKPVSNDDLLLGPYGDELRDLTHPPKLDIDGKEPRYLTPAWYWYNDVDCDE